MIEKLDINSKYIDDLDRLFEEFDKERVLFDIENNTFTNYYIYRDSTRALAFINYHIMYERAELININVFYKYENQGIGSKLIEFMFNDLKSKGVKEVTLEVNVFNYNAIRLYEKFGFKMIAKREKYYDGIDAILMEKELI